MGIVRLSLEIKRGLMELGKKPYRREVKNDLMRLGKKSLQGKSALLISRRYSQRQSNHLLIEIKRT